MKYFVILLVLVGFLIPSVAFAQYLGDVEFYRLPLTLESKSYSILAQSNTNYFTDAIYDDEAGSLIISTSSSEDFIDTYTITMNKQTFSELLATDYAQTPDSMLVLINGMEQPYRIFEDDEVISWQFYAPISTDEVELIPSTPRFGTGTYKFDNVPTNIPRVYPPLKQAFLGNSTENIQCKQNLVLLQKYDGSPACVKPETVSKLVEREWGTSDNWIKISNANTAIHYETDASKITSIEAFSEYKNPSLPGETKQTWLKISLESKHNGVLQITLPRNLIDSKIGDSDDGFFVLLDGIETEYDETKTESERILRIPFPANTDIVEIIGYGHYNSDLEQLDE